MDEPTRPDRDNTPGRGAPVGIPARYRLVCQLGAGGQGSVWLAHDALLQQDVALKVLAPALAANPDVVERLRREAVLTRRVAHPAICHIHDLVITDAATFLVMQYVDGPSLAAVLRAGPMAVARAVPLVIEIARAVAAAHDVGVLHRDLKPGNLIVREDGRVFVVDFGIARAHDLPELTMSGVIVGTRAYIAPELWLGAPPSTLSDVFSLGVILYQTLTSTKPYAARENPAIHETAVPTRPLKPTSLEPSSNASSDGLSVASSLSSAPSAASSEPPSTPESSTEAPDVLPPSARVPGIPAWLDSVAMRAIAPHPKDRFPSARALADALEEGLRRAVEQTTAETTTEITISPVTTGTTASSPGTEPTLSTISSHVVPVLEGGVSMPAAQPGRHRAAMAVIIALAGGVAAIAAVVAPRLPAPPIERAESPTPPPVPGATPSIPVVVPPTPAPTPAPAPAPAPPLSGMPTPGPTGTSSTVVSGRPARSASAPLPAPAPSRASPALVQPVSRERSSAGTLRAHIDDAQARIGRAAALRGLVAGDLPPLQQLQRQLADATSDDDVERLRQLALTEIAAFMPDEVFVLRKRARVQQQAAVADALVRALVARHIARADEALARGAIVDANAALNLGVRAITGGP